MNMKKLLLPLAMIFVFISCEKEISNESLNVSTIAGDVAKVAGKIDVCHRKSNGTSKIINISLNAWPAHQAHGDVRVDDQDNDGYYPDNACGIGPMGDCNDNDASINPGAAEVCGNGIDENCNGASDDVCSICTVTICDQVWMCKNLDVNQYRNGDPIPKVTDPAVWAGLTTGAYCYYNNDSATYASIYGKLYNWYAVAGIFDAASAANPLLRKHLAPAGWHIPSDGEWVALETCLGGPLVAGGKMKEAGTTHWVSNTDATNSSNFTGLPGGFRTLNGTFDQIGGNGDFWSSTEYSNTDGWFLFLNYFHGLSIRSNLNKHYGFSVRCLRD